MPEKGRDEDEPTFREEPYVNAKVTLLLQCPDQLVSYGNCWNFYSLGDFWSYRASVLLMASCRWAVTQISKIHLFVTAVCKYPCAVLVLALRWGGGSWCFASLGEEGGRQRVDNWQEPKSLPLRCHVSSTEEGETVIVLEGLLLSLTKYFCRDSCTPGWFQKTWAPWPAAHTPLRQGSHRAKAPSSLAHGAGRLGRALLQCPLLFPSFSQLSFH